MADNNDVSKARRAARQMAERIGMDKIAAAEVEASTSELATNLVLHAVGGTITVELVEEDGRKGVRIISNDEGPGIENVEQALKEGYSSRDTLGSGLSGIERMMDEFDLQSEPGRGTRVVATKWLK